MFISHVSYKDFVGIMYRSIKVMSRTPGNRVRFLVSRILYGLIAIFLLATGTIEGIWMLSFVITASWAISPAMVVTFVYLFLFGITGYSADQIIFLSKPKKKKFAELQAKYDLKNAKQIGVPHLRHLFTIKKTMALVYKPSKRELRKLRKQYPNLKITYGKKVNKKKAPSYSVAFRYKHYLVFFAASYFSKRAYSIIDLNDARNAELWQKIKSNNAYYKKLVTDNVQIPVNGQL